MPEDRPEHLRPADWSREMGFWEWDPARDRLVWLNDWWRNLDLFPCEGEAHVSQLREVIDPEHWPRAEAAYQAHASGRSERYEAEYRVRTRRGDWRWVAMFGHIVERAADGTPVRVLGAAFDIEARKELEADLERQGLQFDAVATSTPTWIIAVDLEQRIEFCNRPIRGVPPEDCVGRPIGELVGQEEAERFARYCRVAIEQRAPVQYRGVIDDGRRVLETRLSPLVAAGKPSGTVSVIIDVTERLSLERAVLEIADRERRRFGADVHDGLGQVLTGVALSIKTLLKTAELDQSSLAAGLREVLDLTNEAIVSSRQLARGLSPAGREQGGLGPAIASLAQQLDRPAGPRICCRVGDGTQESLDPIVADHLYRIAQEAITNALRHAQPSEISVALDVDPGTDQVQLEISDDGCGLGPTPEFGPGLGLKIMRYRSEVLGGTLLLQDRTGGGTTVRVACPRTGSVARMAVS